MRNLHFGAGNIGRGFIAQILNDNNYEINFVDIDDTIINELKNRDTYNIKILDKNVIEKVINNFNGIHIKNEKKLLYKVLLESELITTAIGPNVLPIIAKDIAEAFKIKYKENNTKKLDVIACENMIDGSSFLQKKIFEYLNEKEKEFILKYVAFPNAAVDRIVPQQSHKDKLLVEVEKFSEWIIEESKIKVPNNKNIKGVHYVSDLYPYIERKLFTVNTGHAALSYIANYKGIKIVNEGLKDKSIKNQLLLVLNETKELLLKKWNFNKKDLTDYVNNVIKRFENPYIIDETSRICRTPIRKLGYNERFIKPIRECKERGLEINNLATICSYILKYRSVDDEQSLELEKMLNEIPVEKVFKQITGLEDDEIINLVVKNYNEL
ncbi:mannitol-1-phosphate 5-dehydrogenase [Oceanivirga salmonicida]|uniref:mannitol-1-phosphate 5-dehydrogenase n=1 Tax=Oceanivirga salmonicida TaxID=1769291 RepID=UPI0012E0DF8F|nr:mannitol-1-phosphate 5-dehydrogenase [Oceanivirga salmonicida]